MCCSHPQGGELEVLKSINWATIRFDVLCIETEPSNRPPNYPQLVTAFLEERGYKNATGQQGRNICKLTSLLIRSFEPKPLIP
jgi:hypothetical protein